MNDKRKIILNLFRNIIKPHNIENYVADLKYSVYLRRLYYEKKYNMNFINIPYKNYNYNKIYKKNCENVIGYTKIPIGISGPIIINDITRLIPFSTTEGALVASVNKGMKAIMLATNNKGIKTITYDKGITRAPIIELKNIRDVYIIKN